MVYLLQPKANVTENLDPGQDAYEIMLLGLFIVISICSFFYINCVLLFTLRSKPVFCETSRFILLFNLLFADTFQQVPNLLLYILAWINLKIPYYACGFLVVVSVVADSISPLTLAVMSVERYVAVCLPLRHATIFTVRSTGMAIAVVWALSFINILIRVFMLVRVFTIIPFNPHMNEFCSKEALFFAPIFNDFEKVYASTLFVSVGLAIIGSYVGVALVATSASTDKASARKVLQTLLLHLIQLCLVLTSSMFSTIIIVIARTAGRLTVLRIYNVCFVFLSILPRCLSALIYGLRDQTIRPVLMQNLCCGWKSSVFPNKSR
ncbi:odorant receptor 131-2-like [Sander lucioperca]|uniref:odorant receptor 131-2-like n=1 Tax=Sander lucioperca TaxID=283035 RepID=UPI00125CFB8D|nr:odorant receptor 131-2-like [Sander lucioperca]